MKIAILLTATVRPQVSDSNFSVAERKEMYRSTLQFYAKEIGRKHPIVLVENSDIDLSSWQQEFKDSLQLEILQFTPPPPNLTEISYEKTTALTTARERDTMSI